MAVGGLTAVMPFSTTFIVFLTFFASYPVSECKANKLFIKEIEKVSASSLIISHAPNCVSFLPNAGAVPVDEISNIAALILGFSSLKDITWSGLLAGNVFKRPKANVLITVEGIVNEDKLDVAEKVAAYPVHENEAGSRVSDALALSNVQGETLAKYVSDLFQGKSLTVSLSADEQEALAGFADGSNSHTLYWNNKKETFASLQEGGLGSVTASKEKILKRFETTDYGKGVKYSSDGRVFTVAVPGKGKAVFDMKKREDFLLFAELDAVFQLVNHFFKNPDLVNDGVPDVFTITISSLKAVRSRYGGDSLQAEAAVILLKTLLPKISAQFATLYHGNCVVEILTLKWLGDLNDKYADTIQQIFQQVQPHLQSPSVEMFRHNLPSINLREDLDDLVKESLCSSLHSKLINIQSRLKIDCLGSHHRGRRAVDLLDSNQMKNVTNLNLAVTYNSNYPVIFNIWLWLVIGIGLSLYAVSIVLWYMDPGRDSIIYRMTSQRIKSE